MNLAFSYLIDILSKILNDDIINDKNINNEIVKYLLENCIKKNQIDVLITKITNKNYMKKILSQKDLKGQKNSIPIPEIKDFLINEDIKSIIILKKFIDDGQFENKDFFDNEGYGKKMVKLLEEIKKKFEEYNFNIEESDKILNLQKGEFLDNRLNLIF